MQLRDKNFLVEVCETTGATARISAAADEMNWVLDHSNWGLIDGFETQSVSEEDGKILVITRNEKKSLAVIIEKKLNEDGYFETYSITNNSHTEFFLTKENFGIPMPYDCLYDPGRDIMNDCCLTHLWCGGDCAWMYSVKCNGYAPYLAMDVTEGAIDDYSIDYDLSRTINGSFYRGAFVLHPRQCVIMPGEELKLVFRYRFTDEKPETAPLSYENAIRLTADRYSIWQGETVKILFESAAPWENLKLLCNGEELTYTKNGNCAEAVYAFSSVGERKITAEVDGKKTWLYLNVLLPVDEILQKRADFITQKQQYHKLGSHIDGAYLIYDDDTKSVYYDDVFPDHNAGRERVAMGVVVCKAQQAKYDEKRMESLKKYRTFIEREIFDEETGVVYNQVCRDNTWERVFNFPWVATFYLEYYRLTGERKCLENAGKILVKFFELTEGRFDAQCIEAYNTIQCLEKEGFSSMAQRLKELFLHYLDSINSVIAGGKHMLETSYVSEYPNLRMCYFSQAYLLTGKGEYLTQARDYYVKTQAFFGQQPDFHLNGVNIRYWDRYWFGKHQSYGDVFPHYWSSLAGWGMYWYDKACRDGQARYETYSNLTGNLCVYREDGFAANNYYYPYKVVQHFKTTETMQDDQISGAFHHQQEHLRPGVFYGKDYDHWANDQDWALYYAATIL